MKKLFKSLAVVLAVYLMLLSALFFNQRNLMYHPNTNDPDFSKLEHTFHEIVNVKTSDDLIIRGAYLPPRAYNGLVIVMMHGNSGNISQRFYKADILNTEGFGVLMVGYRGFGGNDGKISEQGLYKDARAHIAWLKKNGISEERMVFYGESIGSGPAVQMATEYSEAGLILEAPFDSAVALAKQRYPYAPVNILMRDKFENVEKIADINTPLLILHGDEDNVVPVQNAKTLFEDAKDPKIFNLAVGAGHNNLYDFDAPLHITSFLRTIKPSSKGNESGSRKVRRKTKSENDKDRYALPQRYNN